MGKRRKFTDGFKAQVALEALRGDPTIQEIAAKHRVHPNQVSTWKRQAVEGMADVFARAGKAEGPMEPEVKELHAKIGRLAVENFFVSRAQAMRPANKKALIRRDHPELSIRHELAPFSTGNLGLNQEA